MLCTPKDAAVKATSSKPVLTRDVKSLTDPWLCEMVCGSLTQRLE
jgi:hypothetical protein